ncbi:DUF7289 family protein [Natronorarus salvus]|uniref:DUF7289 family protein n=1 Tax=Natronorarus salvus TaxID=3117733 RepID=UPI002F25F881
MDDRAVSEVVGYVLVLALVVTTMGVLFTTGFGTLQDVQRAEQVNNVERAFDVLDANLQDMYREGAPSRATEMRLVDGSLGFGQPTTIDVAQDGETIGNLTVSAYPIEYDSGDGTQIVYAHGALIRAEGDGSVMLAEPNFVLDDDHVVVSGVRTRPLSDSPTSIDRTGTVLIGGEHLRTDTSTSESSNEPLTITVETQHVDAWEGYFREHEDRGIGDVVERTDDSVTFQIDHDDYETASVVRPVIRIAFRN